MLNSLEDETKNKEKEDTNEGNVTSDSIQSKSLEDIHINNKSIMSEERWKFYSDRNNLINKDLK